MKRTKVVTIRLTPKEDVMLNRLSTPKKPKSAVVRDLIRKSYHQATS